MPDRFPRVKKWPQIERDGTDITERDLRTKIAGKKRSEDKRNHASMEIVLGPSETKKKTWQKRNMNDFSPKSIMLPIYYYYFHGKNRRERDE